MKLYQYFFMSGRPLAISVAIKLAYIIELCPLSKGCCQQNRVPSGKVVPRALLLKKPLKKLWRSNTTKVQLINFYSKIQTLTCTLQY